MPTTTEQHPPYAAPMMAAFVDGMPENPPAELDPYLDAAARCFARYGHSRTSVQDVANEMGYNRATVYKKVGTVDAITQLLFAREVHRYLDTMGDRDWGIPGPDTIVEILAVSVGYIREHPVVAKVLADEMASTAGVLAKNIGSLRDYFLAGMTTPITLGMQLGSLAQRDPTAVIEWIFRMLISLIVLPPVGDLRETLREFFIPVLTPVSDA